MDEQDLSSNLTITRLKTLTRDLEHSRTIEQTVRALERAFAESDGLFATLLLSTRGLGNGEYRVVRMHLADDPATLIGHSKKRQSVPVQAGGVLSEIVARAEPHLLQNVDWSHDPFFSRTLKGCGSVIAVPVLSDHLPMNWAILVKKTPERFTVSDLEEALERTALAGALLENQMPAGELASAKQRIDREARQVGELQRSLLPASLPRIAGVEIAASYEPSGLAGGDLYDLFPLDGQHNGHCDTRRRWCIFIGDTAGHGLAAAVVIAIVQAVLHAHPARIARPATLLTHANRQLCAKGLGGFVTAFLGVYEPESRRLTYANAGHPPPLLRRSSDASIVALDEVGSYPMGIEHSETFREAVVLLEPGDTLLLYTDGVTEARDKNDEMFEQHRLRRILQDAEKEPAELIERLRAAVQAHENGGPSRDDQTLLVARVL